MKKYSLITFVVINLFSCKKSDKPIQTYCYECDISNGGTPKYVDYPCMTEADWNLSTITVKDSTGTRQLDKAKSCRKK
jgi:hypothetical protein